jgi:hypothetical protein
MAQENRALSTFFASLRVLGGAACSLVALLCGAVQAQQPGVFHYRWHGAPPAEAITPFDIREALMWTGHLDAVFKGEIGAAVLQAAQAWQKSRGHRATDKLSDKETSELIQQALKERDAVGWSVLRDPAVGFSVGIPARLVTLRTPRIDGAALIYGAGGAVSQMVRVNHGSPSCKNMSVAYTQLTAGAAFRAHLDNWFVALFRQGDTATYLKMACHATGSITTEMTVPTDMLEKHPGMFAAMASSLMFLRVPDPTVRPRPRIDELPLAPAGFSEEQVARPQAKSKTAKPADIDASGKTAALTFEMRDGPDLRADEVFEKASGAVYVVKAGSRMGSAVAISDSELLTNCHVMGDLPEAKISRAKAELPAKLVSRNADADRCVLRTASKLATWVSVRPYEDIKVGERAITIGTPQGLELTAAEGIVSSKRLYNQSRVIQTSAPISQGSSGGGLFDARGHLLGITTFYFRGGQNLNFAVAAEEFAQDREQSANR